MERQRENYHKNGGPPDATRSKLVPSRHQERMSSESESLCPMIIFLDLFKVRARAAKVIFACCFRDPRGLFSRERDMFRRQTFEI